MMRNANGVEKFVNQSTGQTGSVLYPICYSTAGLTSTKTMASTTSFAYYIGKAPRALTTMQLRTRVTQAVATITYAEVGIARGAVNIGAGPTLTALGFADVSATYNTTGQKSTTINVSSGQTINEGDDLWVVFGVQATTTLGTRAFSIADDIQVGVQGFRLNYRISTNIGTPQAFTIELATDLPPWFALVI